MASTKKLGIALFGAGRIGTVHFRNLILSECACAVWVVEEDPSIATNLVQKYSMLDKVKVGSNKDIDTILQDTEVDAVMVCTPSFTHEAVIRAALNAGKPVFSEKPLTPSVESTQECFDLAEAKGVPLMCGFNRRFDPQVRTLYRALRAGGVGGVRAVRSTSRDPPGMMTRSYLITSGGIFLDSVIHDIDLTCWLVGEAPVTVYATGHAGSAVYAECDDVTTGVAMLVFPCGAIATIEVSRDAHVGYDQRVEVLCEKGLLQSENMRPQQYHHSSLEGTLMAPIADVFSVRYVDSYRLEIEHFVDVVKGGAALEVGRSATLLANMVAEACKLSCKSGEIIKFQQFRSKFDTKV